MEAKTVTIRKTSLSRGCRRVKRDLYQMYHYKNTYYIQHKPFIKVWLILHLENPCQHLLTQHTPGGDDCQS